MLSFHGFGQVVGGWRLFALKSLCLVLAYFALSVNAAKSDTNPGTTTELFRLAKAFDVSARPSHSSSTIDLVLAVSDKMFPLTPETPLQIGNEHPSAPPAVRSSWNPVSKPGPKSSRRPGGVTNYGVFASIAVPIGGLPMQPVFKALLPSSRQAASVKLAKWKRWHGLKAQSEGTSLRKKLTVINKGVNGAIAYRSDARVHGVPDYWAPANETVRLGQGDCEDIAIVKLYALAALGIPLDQLQLVVLKDRRRSLYHAVLAVHAGSTSYILDNVTAQPRKDTAIANYQPLYSFANNGSFIHGFKIKGSSSVTTANAFGPIHPGLGAPDAVTSVLNAEEIGPY